MTAVSALAARSPCPAQAAASGCPRAHSARPSPSRRTHQRPAGALPSIGRSTRQQQPQLAAIPRSTRLRAVDAEAPAALDAAIDVLYRACDDASVDKGVVFQAMMALDRMKLPTDGLKEAACDPKKKWRLVYTADKEAVASALKAKGDGQGGLSGKYFPITAVQTWDGKAGKIENGVYLGRHVAALKFSGPFYMLGKKLDFDFTKLQLKLGPWEPTFNIKDDSEVAAEFKKFEEAGGKGNKGPFFLFVYVDDKIAIARGKGGGIAMWATVSEAWQMEAGIM